MRHRDMMSKLKLKIQ